MWLHKYLFLIHQRFSPLINFEVFTSLGKTKINLRKGLSVLVFIKINNLYCNNTVLLLGI